MRSSFFRKQVAGKCRFICADAGVLFVRVRRPGLYSTHAGAKSRSGAVCRSNCDRRAGHVSGVGPLRLVPYAGACYQCMACYGSFADDRRYCTDRKTLNPTMSTVLIWAIAAGTIAAVLLRPKNWPEAVWACLG